MRTTITAILAFVAASASAAVGPQINGNQINPQTAIAISSLNVTGAAGLTATSGTFTASGATQYSVQTASGVKVLAGTLLVQGSGGVQAGANPVRGATNGSDISGGTVGVLYGGTGLASAGGTANRVLRTSDGSALAMGQVIGPDVAAGTIPVSALNQSGAASTNVLAWNGSAWAPSAAAAGTVSTTAGAVAGATTRFTAATTISSGAFTDNGATVTVPSGKAFIVSAGATFQFPQISTTVYPNTAAYLAGGGSGANQFGCLVGSTASWTADGVSTYTVTSAIYGKMDSTLGIASWYLIDGGYFPGYSASIANGSNDGGQVAANTNMGLWTNNQISPTGGTHSVCVVLNSHGAGGGANISINSANADGGTQASYRSFVRVSWP